MYPEIFNVDASCSSILQAVSNSNIPLQNLSQYHLNSQVSGVQRTQNFQATAQLQPNVQRPQNSVILPQILPGFQNVQTVSNAPNIQTVRIISGQVDNGYQQVSRRILLTDPSLLTFDA